MLILDAHLDLAMNALEWNRDLRRPLEEIRERDRHYDDRSDRGQGTVSLPEMRRAGMGLCVATQIARYVKPKNRRPGWHSPEQAWAQTQGQLAWYRAMEEQGEMIQINDRAGLDRHVERWQSALAKSDPASPEPADLPVGYILSLEGADSILSCNHLARAHEQGLRALGPAHYGPGTYAHGTESSGGLSATGRELLKEMEALGLILDVTHLCDESFWEALDQYHGPVWASHNNCRALVPHHRQFSDDQIKALLERGAVIGGVFDAWMMVPGWTRGKTTPEEAQLKLETIIDHFDHICQMAGNADHIGIGSDLDGGFGREQTPMDLRSIADLARLPDLLGARGYGEDDVSKIMHVNFLRFVRDAWS